ncbi:MAG: PAS domain S-box protein [Deltaproteobacteria bacterium]|nr:PAS domain S-box protein [Deltaproteobacteria bacterium]
MPGVVFSFRRAPDGATSLPYTGALFKEYFPLLSSDDLAQDATAFFQTMHPDDLPRVYEAIEVSARTLRSAVAQWRIQHPTKGEIWIEAAAVPEPEGDGSILWQGFAQEITTRKQAEKVAQQWAHIFETAAFGMSMSDVRTNTLTRVNPAFARQRGYTVDELIGKPFATLIPTDRHEEMKEVIQRLEDKDHVVFELEHLRKDGSRFPVLFEMTLVRDEKGRPASRVTYAIDISERKATGAALRASEVKFRTVVDQAGDLVALFDEEGRIIDVNQRLIDVLGYGREELLKLYCWEFLSGRTKDEMLSHWHSLKPGQTITREGYNLRKDGTRYPAEARVTRVEIGGRDCFLTLVRDVTERQKMLGALSESEQRFRVFFDSASVGLSQSFAGTGCMARVNPKFCEMVGYSAEELYQLSWDDITHPEDRACNYAEFVKLAGPEGGGFHVEKRFIHKDGHVVWVDVMLNRVVSENGTPEMIIGVAQDITQRKQAALELRESREFLRTVLDILPQRVFWKDREGKFLGANASLMRDLGPLDLIGKTDQEMPWKGKQADFFQACDRRVMESGVQEMNILEPLTLPDGSTRWLSTCKVPLRQPDGEIYGVLGTYMDVTAMKTAETALRESEERHRRIIDTAFDAVISIDGAGDVTGWNGRAEEIFGWSAADAYGRKLSEMIIPQRLREEHEKGLRRYLESRQARVIGRRVELPALRRSGEEFPAEFAVTAFEVDGEPYFTAFLQDITERKLAEKELRKHRNHLEELVAEQTLDLRLAKEAAEAADRAKTQFLANMSHELRTPMHAILSFAKRGEDVALTMTPEKLRGYFSNIATGGSRLLALLNNLLDLSKLEAGSAKFDMAENDLREVVDAVSQEFSQLVAERNIEIAVETISDNTRGWCDCGAMHQVIRNVVSNAFKFSPNGGKIHIALRDGELPVGRRATDTEKCDALAIEISDQGCGIPETELEAVFDKFVQSSKTKSKAGGTGLGLAICREIMNGHCGTIDVRNNPQAGVTFAIKLPRQAREHGARFSRASGAQGAGREL